MKRMRMPVVRCGVAMSLVLAGRAVGAVLEVGEGRAFATIEAALGAARSGDTVRVHAPAKGAAYPRVAALVRTPGLRIVAAPDPERLGERVRLSGEGFEYSGRGSVPRAIVQFEPGAEGCVLEGFELEGAHNTSHNGAGVRINQANHVTIRGCSIHGNDMGVMSNGNGTPKAAADQRIEGCLIHSNGSTAEPGQNHNLYLGGTSVVVSGCEIRSSTTGHNVKSRAHSTRVEYCWVHDAASREFDLVDGKGDTSAPGSDAVVIGCIIAKRPDTTGNRNVIHFGQDGGHEHTGELFLVHNTIVTPYVSPVVEVSSPGVPVVLAGNLITDGGHAQKGQRVVAAAARGGAAEKPPVVGGQGNAFSGGFTDMAGLGASLVGPVRFVDSARGDWRLVDASGVPAGARGSIEKLGLPGVPGRAEDHPGVPLLRYVHPSASGPREDGDAPLAGACGAAGRR